MRAVYKYKLTTAETQTIKMPYGSRVVHTGLQWCEQENNHQICIWAEVNSEHLDNLVDRRFDIVGTGYIISNTTAFHVGTVQVPPNTWGNIFVWHVYEVPQL